MEKSVLKVQNVALFLYYNYLNQFVGPSFRDFIRWQPWGLPAGHVHFSIAGVTGLYPLLWFSIHRVKYQISSCMKRVALWRLLQTSCTFPVRGVMTENIFTTPGAGKIHEVFESHRSFTRFVQKDFRIIFTNVRRGSPVGYVMKWVPSKNHLGANVRNCTLDHVWFQLRRQKQ